MVFHIFVQKLLVTFLPIDFVDEIVSSLTQPLKVQSKNIQQPRIVKWGSSTDVWRNSHILRTPQWMLIRQRLRISDIKRRTLDSLRIKRLDEIIGIDDRPSGNVNQESPLLTENFKLRLWDQSLGLVGQWHWDDEDVQPWIKKFMDLFFGSAGEPFAREFTLWITEARRRVGVIAAGLRGVSRVKGVSVNV